MYTHIYIYIYCWPLEHEMWRSITTEPGVAVVHFPASLDYVSDARLTRREWGWRYHCTPLRRCLFFGWHFFFPFFWGGFHLPVADPFNLSIRFFPPSSHHRCPKFPLVGRWKKRLVYIAGLHSPFLQHFATGFMMRTMVHQSPAPLPILTKRTLLA